LVLQDFMDALRKWIITTTILIDQNKNIMRNIIKYCIIAGCSSVLFYSCSMFKMDNYEAPNSSVTGAILDSITGEPVQMDVAEGSYILYYQRNYGPQPEAQAFTFFSDGTFKNTQVFAGTYDFVMANTNFVPIDTVKNVVFEKGKNTHVEIKVLPYHSLTNWVIKIDGNELVASTFLKLNTTRITNQTYAYWSDRMAVFIDPAPYVGNFYNVYKKESGINWPILNDWQKEIRISLDDPDLVKAIKKGKQYYVRIGVLTFGSTANGALFDGYSKYNFTPAVRIQF